MQRGAKTEHYLNHKGAEKIVITLYYLVQKAGAMKQAHKYILTLAALVLFLSGCCSWDYDRKDIEFSQEELNHFGSYRLGDTVYFESNAGDMDTIAIVDISERRNEKRSCFMTMAPHHSRGIAIAHLPIRRFPPSEWFTSKIAREEKDTVDGQELISIQKDPLQKKTRYYIGFREFLMMGDSVLGAFQPVYTVAGRTIKNSYRITHSYPERIYKHTDIEVVYWTDKLGLTAYTSKSGETWFVKTISRAKAAANPS